MTQFDRFLKYFGKAWFFLLAVVSIIISILYLDKPLAFYVHTHDLHAYQTLLSVIAACTKGETLLVAVVIATLLFRYVIPLKDWEMRFWFLSACVFFSSLFCTMLKMLLGRARPSLLFEHDIYGFFGFRLTGDYWSFPSGHTTALMSLMFGFAAVFPRYCYQFILFGLIMVSGRILLMKHFLGDVLAGTCLAFVVVMLTYKCWKLYVKNEAFL